MTDPEAQSYPGYACLSCTLATLASLFLKFVTEFVNCLN